MLELSRDVIEYGGSFASNQMSVRT